MSHEISCEMIQDLLPLYLDDLTREATAREIEEHLNTCDSCRGSYEKMKAALEIRQGEQQREAAREIQYLKGLKRRTVGTIIGAVAAALLVTGAGIWMKLFLIGSPSDAYFCMYLNSDENQIYAGGAFGDSASVYVRHKLVKQPDGTQKLVVYKCLASGWNRNGVFNITLNMEDVEQQVEINGAIVKKDGTVITKTANELYRARNPYIGDVSANGRLAGILRMGEQLGGFKSRLQTTQEPYGWTLIHEDSVRNSAAFESRMRDYACVLLALTDNLGEMTWIYTVETVEGAVERATVWTEEEASEYLGAPVKSFRESPEKVQELLDLLELPDLP